VPDWITDAWQSILTSADQEPLANIVLMAAISLVMPLVLVALHEAGHALAALCTDNPVQELRVGNVDAMRERARGCPPAPSSEGFPQRLRRLVNSSDTGGFVRYDATTATPTEVIVMALAGPFANLLGAAALAFLASQADGFVSFACGLWSFTSLGLAISNLVPGRDGGPGVPRSDGYTAREAWRARRAGHVAFNAYDQPDAATSVPPP
jgi:hypothetical protein